MERFISRVGLLVFLGICYLCSHHRAAIRWPTVLWGLALQLGLAVIILKTGVGLTLFKILGNLVTQFLNFSDAGAEFVFGEGFTEHFIAFKVLPTIVFFSAVINVLYHYGILQQVVAAIAYIMQKTMKTSGAETLCCAANIFVGQTEAPLLIKPYIETLTQSELYAVMTGGFATIAGGVMAAYISFGIPPEHILAASVMSAPAALAVSKVLYPETEPAKTGESVQVATVSDSGNGIDALASGAHQGMMLALNVGAMLIAFLALLAFVNAIFAGIGAQIGVPDLSLEWLLSYILAPVAWLMGVPAPDCAQVGVLLGKKTIFNEFIAYLDLKTLMENSEKVTTGELSRDAVPVISERGKIIATYALCGFANFGSIGIQIGGIGGIAPQRQADVARLGVQTMLAGTVACFMTACVAGMLL